MGEYIRYNGSRVKKHKRTAFRAFDSAESSGDKK